MPEIKKMEKDLKERKVNPKDLKVKLAKEIVSIYHDRQKADRAEKEFNKVFKEKEAPSKIREIKINRKEINILDLLVEAKLAESKSEAKRLVEQGAVKIDGAVKNDRQEIIKIGKEIIVKAGKRKFAKIS